MQSIYSSIIEDAMGIALPHDGILWSKARTQPFPTDVSHVKEVC